MPAHNPRTLVNRNMLMEMQLIQPGSVFEREVVIFLTYSAALPRWFVSVKHQSTFYLELKLEERQIE